MNYYLPYAIETDIKADLDFFKPYITDITWTDINVLYKKYDEYQETMVNHFVSHIETYDMKLKKFIVRLFKELGIKSKDFRADFFLTKAGGNMPMHIDGMSKVALLLPLTLNTGPLVCETENTSFEICYQTLTILNTQISHGVKSPTTDRLLFRIALHDTLFEDLSIYKEYRNKL